MTPQEVELLANLTGFEPVGIEQIDDLWEFAERCKRYYWGDSKDAVRLHGLIDDQIEELLTQSSGHHADFA
ncbi:hypothetical protein [Pseudoduganella rivuli]|uniref:hypothetical protein n=1 Tax=Pseudoduganella rivuli TaxID=2666085 RepID=UPI001E51CFFC|nr:hypothetical protein [Pseudoduganella rivuli]